MLATDHFDVANTAMKFYLDISYGYLVMVRTRIVWKKKLIKTTKVTQQLRKGEQSFLYACPYFDDTLASVLPGPLAKPHV